MHPESTEESSADEGHECRTVQEAGWAGKKNGELLSIVENDFDVLVTVDTNLQYQQNLTGRRIAIVIFQSASNRLDHLRGHFPACVLAIETIKPGEIAQIGDEA